MVNQQRKSARVTVMDSTHWYFAVHGNGYGPFTFEQLQQLARTEMISPSNFVWQQDETESRHVKDIDGLLRDFVPTQSPSRLRQAIWCGSTALIILGGFLAFHFFGDRFQMSEQSGNSEMAESASSQHSDQATEMAETSRSPQPSPLPPSQKSDSNPTNDESNALTSSEPEPPESNASLGKNPIETCVIDAPDKSNHPRKTSATIVAGNVALS